MGKLILRRSTGGMTLLELLLVIFLLMSVTIMAVITLQGFGRTQSANSASDRILALLRDAQNKSAAKENNRDWGVHFDKTSTTAFYALFSIKNGDTCETVNTNRPDCYINPGMPADLTKFGQIILGDSASFKSFDTSACNSATSCDIVFDNTGKPFNTIPSHFSPVQITAGTLQINFLVNKVGLIDSSTGDLTTPGWQYADVATTSAGNVISFFSMATDSNGVPYFTYLDTTLVSSQVSLYFNKCTDAVCSGLTNNPAKLIAHPANNVDQYNAMALGSDGKPRIAYVSGNNIYYVKCTTLECSDVTAPAGTPIAVATGPKDLSLKLTPCTSPNTGDCAMISYHAVGTGSASNKNKLYFVSCQNQSCTSTNGIKSIDAPNSSTNTAGFRWNKESVRSGNPVVGYTFWRPETSFTETDDFRYAACQDTSCSTSSTLTVDTGASRKWWPTISIDTSLLIKASYTDYVNGLKFASCSTDCATVASNWAVKVLFGLEGDSTRFAYTFPSITNNSSNYPRLSFYKPRLGGQLGTNNNGLYYLECDDTTCNNPTIKPSPIDSDTSASFGTTQGAGPSGDNSYNLTSLFLVNGKPRIGYYNTQAGKLRFAYCDSGCTN